MSGHADRVHRQAGPRGGRGVPGQEDELGRRLARAGKPPVVDPVHSKEGIVQSPEPCTAARPGLRAWRG
eukprot:scaffold36274_cov125-Isochrysis_galbana.AAC.6